MFDSYCHYLSTFNLHNQFHSNGSGFVIEHRNQTFLLTAAHTLRRYNDFIFPDFYRWSAEYLNIDDYPIPIYYPNSRQPLFHYFKKDHKELLDVVAIPYRASAGPVDLTCKIGDTIKLCGWRHAPYVQKFIFDGYISNIVDWDITIELTSHTHLKRDGISGGGVYTQNGFVGVYFADDIGKNSSHAVSINYLFNEI